MTHAVSAFINLPMDQFIVPIRKDNHILHFEIRDYPHHSEQHTCKFEIFRENTFVASFEPDGHGYLHICQNPGNVEKETLHKISDEIEKFHW